MSFTTRCPACGTTFKIVADQLKISEGWVRCGHCADVFDATLYLEPWSPDAPAATGPATSPPIPSAPQPQLTVASDQNERRGRAHHAAASALAGGAERRATGRSRFRHRASALCRRQGRCRGLGSRSEGLGLGGVQEPFCRSARTGRRGKRRSGGFGRARCRSRFCAPGPSTRVLAIARRAHRLVVAGLVARGLAGRAMGACTSATGLQPGGPI